MELVSFYAVWSRRVFVSLSLSLCIFPHGFLRDFRPRFLISRCNCYHSLVYRAYREDSKNLITFVLFDIFNFDTCSREVVGFFFACLWTRFWRWVLSCSNFSERHVDRSEIWSRWWSIRGLFALKIQKIRENTDKNVNNMWWAKLVFA